MTPPGRSSSATPSRSGVYSLLSPDKPDAARLFAVNLEASESNLTFLDDELAARDGPGDRLAKVEDGLRSLLPGRPPVRYVEDPAHAAEVGLMARRGVRLWDLALMAVLILALFEPWFANRISQRHYARAGEPPAPTRRGPAARAYPRRARDGARPMMPPIWPLGALRFEGVGHPLLWLLLILAGAGVLFWTYLGALRRAGGRLSWFLMILRGVGLLALVLALAKPTWTRESETVDPGRIAVVLDNSASMSLPDPSGKPRYALALESLGKLREAIDADRSGPKMEVDLFDVNGEAIAGGKPPEAPAVERTDLARGVTEATSKERSKPLTGIVLVSDGMDNTGRADLRELADSPVPIFAVGFRADANDRVRPRLAQGEGPRAGDGPQRDQGRRHPGQDGRPGHESKGRHPPQPRGRRRRVGRSPGGRRRAAPCDSH